MPSGGHNRASYAEHVLRNNVRPHRHPQSSPVPAAPPLSAADRRRTLKGLPAPARRLAAELLDTFGPWSASALETLRAYARSCVRLEQLQAAADAAPSPALAREVRINLALLKGLDLER